MVTTTGTRLPRSNAATTSSGTTMPTLLPPLATSVVRKVCEVSPMLSRRSTSREVIAHSQPTAVNLPHRCTPDPAVPEHPYIDITHAAGAAGQAYRSSEVTPAAVELAAPSPAIAGDMSAIPRNSACG